ncbi:hypothetical protein EcoAe3A3_46140 [Escherichia coli]|nr:hypothetical protein EcoAe3A3_46140 [Escherichia coli]CTX99782.1 Uncharacterised protein [Escherichia coli]CTY81446.1 Uncharacterised protein [Escherichia coli]
MLKLTKLYKTTVSSPTLVTQHDSECLPNICFEHHTISDSIGYRNGVWGSQGREEKLRDYGVT